MTRKPMPLVHANSANTFAIVRNLGVDKAFALRDDAPHVPPRQLHIHGLDSRTHDHRAVLGIRLKA